MGDSPTKTFGMQLKHSFLALGAIPGVLSFLPLAATQSVEVEAQWRPTVALLGASAHYHLSDFGDVGMGRLHQAIATIGSQRAVLFLDTDDSLGDDVTVPADIGLVGAVLNLVISQGVDNYTVSFDPIFKRRSELGPGGTPAPIGGCTRIPFWVTTRRGLPW